MVGMVAKYVKTTAASHHARLLDSKILQYQRLRLEHLVGGQQVRRIHLLRHIVVNAHN